MKVGEPCHIQAAHHVYKNINAVVASWPRGTNVCRITLEKSYNGGPETIDVYKHHVTKGHYDETRSS